MTGRCTRGAEPRCPLPGQRPAGLSPEALRQLRLAIATSRDALPGVHEPGIAFRTAASGQGSRAALPPREPDGVIAAPAGDQTEIMEIVALAQQGDAEAFGMLYDRYVDLVYRYIYYRVGSHALAEDLASETFLRGLRRISSFTWQGRDIGAWFITIARNLIADHYKSSRYRLEVATAEMLEPTREPAPAGPEAEVLDGFTNTALLDAVKRLGPEQQECIVLRFLQGLSLAETALAMGKNEGSIKALQYRAVRALGRLLPPDLMA